MAAAARATRSPLYDFPASRVIHHLVLRPPVRTSALRGLGALPNVFAIECFIDELAERAGIDPVEYRLSMLSDPRARRIIENVAERSNWAARGAAGSGQGLGLGWARYKNHAAYAAVAAEVQVDREVGCFASGAPPMPAWSSIPTVRATSWKAASCRRPA